MQWALVSTEVQPLTYYINAVYDDQCRIVSEGYYNTIEAEVGTILNMIIYDGVSAYTPPSGTKLIEVPDEARIADTGY